MRIRGQAGFTLVELVIVMGVIAVILSVVVPLLRGMQNESMLSKSEGDLKTIKAAITSYWRNNSNVFPPSIASMVDASPQIITAIPRDHWDTGSLTGEPGTYAYLKGNDSTFGDWFLSCTQGPHNNTGGGGGGGGGGGMPSFSASLQAIDMGPPAQSEQTRCVSNAVIKHSDGSNFAHSL